MVDGVVEGETRVLKPANENPWYVLMTLYGEQDREEIDWELHEKNRADWNAWACQGMSEEERSEAAEASSVTVQELAGWNRLAEKIGQLHEQEMKARNKPGFVYPGLPEVGELAELTDIEFGEMVVLDHFVFNDSVHFHYALFKKIASFNYASFKYGGGFGRVNFREVVCFDRSTFGTDAIFAGAVFDERATFFCSEFSGEARFDSSVFLNEVDFQDATFAGKSRFDNCEFKSSAWFALTSFHGLADFKSALFQENARFLSVTFGQTADFESAFFQKGADFSLSIFSSGAQFSSAKFCASTKFVSAKFNAGAIFESAEFDGEAEFHSATFSEAALFSLTEFSGTASFSGATFAGFTYFGKCIFNSAKGSDQVDFADCQFQKPTSFLMASFHSTYPDFSSTILHDKTSFTDNPANWPQGPQSDPAQAKASCAVIRHNLGKQGLPEAEHFFFRREMGFAGQSGPWWQRPPYWLFGWLSDYGYGILTPLLWLCLLIVGGASVLAWGAAESAPSLDFWQGLGLSFSNAFNFLGFHKTFQTEDLMGKLPPLMKAFSGFQTIGGVILLFFVGLGLRTRFRLR